MIRQLNWKAQAQEIWERNPQVVRFWINWMDTFFPERKYLARVQVHAEDEADLALGFWGQIIGNRGSVKVTVARSRSSSGKIRTIRKLKYGTISTRTSASTDLSVMMGVWMELMPAEWLRVRGG